MSVRRGMLLLVLMLPLLAADAPPLNTATDDAELSDPVRLQGTWRVTRLEDEGEDALERLKGDKPDAKAVIVFKDDKMTIQRVYPVDGKTMTEEVEKLGYRLNVARSIKTIDLIELAERPEAAKCHPGIYRLRGDLLEICFAIAEKKGARPDSFHSKKGNGLGLLVLMKERP